MALRFETIRVGVIALDVHGQAVEFDVRILMDSDGRHRVLSPGDLSEPLPSLEAAVLRVEVGEPVPPEVSRVVRWRPDLAPVPGEIPCPICGAPSATSPRYPRLLCPACVREATDAGGRPLRFFNTDTGGGFEARHADDGTPHAGHECFVRGVRCRADAHHFGGIVVQPDAT
jgi:hypothetical protein